MLAISDPKELFLCLRTINFLYCSNKLFINNTPLLVFEQTIHGRTISETVIKNGHAPYVTSDDELSKGCEDENYQLSTGFRLSRISSFLNELIGAD